MDDDAHQAIIDGTAVPIALIRALGWDDGIPVLLADDEGALTIVGVS